MIVARAPMRISFAGGGTDLAAYYETYDGFVVSTSITRHCYVVARRPADGSIRINSADFRTWQSFEQGRIPPVSEPLSLPKAAIEWFAQRDLLKDGVDLFLASEVAPGSGLGSSSAVAVATIRALAAYTGVPLSTPAAAELACQLEIERLGMPIGKQDQYASAYGGLNTITFTSDGVCVRPLTLPKRVRSALCRRLLLFSTGTTHDSAEILRQQQEDTGSDRLVTQSLHRLKALAKKMCDALVAENLDAFGRLLHRGWQEKKQLSENISTAAIDECYAAAREAGAVGGKISGAGGGGFLLLYCPPGRQQHVRDRLHDLGLCELRFDLDEHGASVLHSGREDAAASYQTFVRFNPSYAQG